MITARSEAERLLELNEEHPYDTSCDCRSCQDYLIDLLADQAYDLQRGN